MTDELRIIKIRRPDTYTSQRVTSTEPNRVPWNVFYVVTTTNHDKIAKLFKTAWVIFPSKDLAIIIKKECVYLPDYSYNYNPATIDKAYDLLMANQACIMVPAYVTKYKKYSYQYSRNSIRAKMTKLGKGLGKFYFLENGVFQPPCLYCPRSAYFVVGDCTPGTDSCLNTFWRGIESQP